MNARVVASVWLALALVTASARAQSWLPDDRVLITDFSSVVGIAVDPWRVHAATLGGLVSYDPVQRRWDLPLTAEDGYPVHERPSALAYDPADRQLLLGTRAGTLWRIDPTARRIEPVTGTGTEVLRIVNDDRAAYVLTARGWFLVEGFGFLTPIPREPAAARAATDPRLASLAGTLGLDPSGRRYAITVVTPGTRRDEFFVGTDGGGMLEVDARTLRAEPRRFGTATSGTASIARVGADLWFGSDAQFRNRPALARADTALQQFTWPGSLNDDQPRGVVHAIAGIDGTPWFAGNDGLFSYDVASNRWRRFDATDGLPTDRVTSLLAHQGHLWVGTTLGACLWRDGTCGPTLLPGLPVSAMSFCDGALWVGTDRGLWRIDTAAERQRSEPIRALACLDGNLFAATPTDLFARRQGSWSPPAGLGARGGIRSLAAGDGVVWVGSDNGLARWDATAGQWAYYIAPADVPPGAIRGILLDGRTLWLATPGGAMRLDLQGR